MVPEAMRAAWILKQDFGYETRILDMHTLKPLDTEAIVHAARDTSIVLTAEEHQIGAPRLAGGERHHPVAGALWHPVITGAIGVKDRFETRALPGS